MMARSAPTPPDLTAYLAEPTEIARELPALFAVAPPRVILDIGACEGEDSIRYSRLFPGARVFAFEPLPGNQALVRANLARYGAERVVLVPVALSDRAGEATFHVSSGRPPVEFSGADWNYGNKSSSLLPPAGDAPMHGWIEFKETITVPTDTLDRFCGARGIDRIDFIHLDVQGAEHLVLAGAEATLPRVTALWLEVSDERLYAGQKVRAEIGAFLRARGFALAFESRREVEGDQLYVNRRRVLTWPYLARCRARGVLLGARRRAGRIRRALFG